LAVENTAKETLTAYFLLKINSKSVTTKQ